MAGAVIQISFIGISASRLKVLPSLIIYTVPSSSTIYILPSDATGDAIKLPELPSFALYTSFPVEGSRQLIDAVPVYIVKEASVKQ